MSLICWLRGHKPETSIDFVPYGDISDPDCLAEAVTICKRCNDEIGLKQVLVPKWFKERPIPLSHLTSNPTWNAKDFLASLNSEQMHELLLALEQIRRASK